MTNYKMKMLSITLLSVVIQILIIFGLIVKGHFDYGRSVMVTTLFLVLYTFVEARYGFYMNNYIRTIVALTLVMDAFFGLYLDLYATSSIFDKILHLFGTYSFSLFAYILAVQLVNNPINRSFTFILVVCLGLSIGGFYEILEFFTDQISHPVPPSQPSLLDTNLDLIADFLGAVLAALHVTYRNFFDPFGRMKG